MFKVCKLFDISLERLFSLSGYGTLVIMPESIVKLVLAMMQRRRNLCKINIVIINLKRASVTCTFCITVYFHNAMLQQITKVVCRKEVLQLIVFLMIDSRSCLNNKYYKQLLICLSSVYSCGKSKIVTSNHWGLPNFL